MSRGLSEKRRQLLLALEEEIRKVTGQGVILSHAIAERANINSTDMECLDILTLVGAVPAGRLADLTGLTTGAITGVIDRLEKSGYVRRETDPNDRRRVIIQPQLDRLGEIQALYRSLQHSMTEMSYSYSESELQLILDFFTKWGPILQEETARLRGDKVVEADEEDGAEFTAPLGTATAGKLVFMSGAEQITLSGNAAMGDLYRAHFTQQPPAKIKVVGSKTATVTISQARFSLPNLTKMFQPPEENAAEVILNGRIPWHIEVRGGIWHFKGDLSTLLLQKLEFTGGANKANLTLVAPTSTVPIRASGGINEFRINKRRNVAMSVNMKGGDNKLFINGKPSGSPGKMRWETLDYRSAAGRYSLEVSGGTNTVYINHVD